MRVSRGTYLTGNQGANMTGPGVGVAGKVSTFSDLSYADRCKLNELQEEDVAEE